jgi:23S rRNA (adenine2030-N6)-methyltransferase
MLSYQHSYHAGNPADLHKHALLCALLDLLTRKPRPITAMETHSGRGLYDLSSDAARKTGEAAEGVEALVALPDTRLGRIIRQTRALHGTTAYPGSPAVTRALLRENDRHILMERHPVEHAALKTNMRGSEVHFRDGYEGVMALSPPKPRRGLVLIDPSYEVKSEYDAAAAFALRLVAKWPEAAIMIWYPILPAARHLMLLGGLRLPIWRHEVEFALKGGTGLIGSGVAVVNAPYGFDAVANEEIHALEPLLRPIP